MNDEINPNDNLAEEWEMSLPEMPSGKSLTGPSGDQSSAKAESIVPNKNEDWSLPPADAGAPKGAAAEEWAITEPLKQPQTSPNASGWKLSEPVFRSSEGYTPKISPQTAPPAKIENAQEPVDFSTIPAPEIPQAAQAITVETKPEALPASLNQGAAPAPAAIAPAADVEPQPDVIEDLVVEPAVAAPLPAVKPQSKIWRIASVIAGLLAMFIFIVGFLILVYYFFLHKAAE